MEQNTYATSKSELNSESSAFQYQPHVYQFATYLAERFQSNYLISIGEPSAVDLRSFHPAVNIIGIVPGTALNFYRNEYPFGTWLEGKLNGSDEISSDEIIFERDILNRA